MRPTNLYSFHTQEHDIVKSIIDDSAILQLQFFSLGLDPYNAGQALIGILKAYIYEGKITNALTILESIREPFAKIRGLTFIAEYYFEHEDPTNGYKYLDLAFALLKSNNVDTNPSKSSEFILTHMVKLYTKNGNIEKAIEVANIVRTYDLMRIKLLHAIIETLTDTHYSTETLKKRFDYKKFLQNSFLSVEHESLSIEKKMKNLLMLIYIQWRLAPHDTATVTQYLYRINNIIERFPDKDQPHAKANILIWLFELGEKKSAFQMLHELPDNDIKIHTLLAISEALIEKGDKKMGYSVLSIIPSILANNPLIKNSDELRGLLCLQLLDNTEKENYLIRQLKLIHDPIILKDTLYQIAEKIIDQPKNNERLLQKILPLIKSASLSLNLFAFRIIDEPEKFKNSKKISKHLIDFIQQMKETFRKEKKENIISFFHNILLIQILFGSHQYDEELREKIRKISVSPLWDLDNNTKAKILISTGNFRSSLNKDGSPSINLALELILKTKEKGYDEIMMLLINYFAQKNDYRNIFDIISHLPNPEKTKKAIVLIQDEDNNILFPYYYYALAVATATTVKEGKIDIAYRSIAKIHNNAAKAYILFVIATANENPSMSIRDIIGHPLYAKEIDKLFIPPKSKLRTENVALLKKWIDKSVLAKNKDIFTTLHNIKD